MVFGLRNYTQVFKCKNKVSLKIFIKIFITKNKQTMSEIRLQVMWKLFVLLLKIFSKVRFASEETLRHILNILVF